MRLAPPLSREVSGGLLRRLLLLRTGTRSLSGSTSFLSMSAFSPINRWCDRLLCLFSRLCLSLCRCSLGSRRRSSLGGCCRLRSFSSSPPTDEGGRSLPLLPATDLCRFTDGLTLPPPLPPSFASLNHPKISLTRGRFLQSFCNIAATTSRRKEE